MQFRSFAWRRLRLNIEPRTTGGPQISLKHSRVPLIEKPLTGRHWVSFQIECRELKANNHAIVINNISLRYPNDLRPMINGQIIKTSDPMNEVY